MAPARLLLTALLLASLTAISPPAALALQRIEARDGVSVEAAIALKEPTRIKIDGGAISDVFGNIYSTNCGAHGRSAAMLPNGQAAPGGQPGRRSGARMRQGQGRDLRQAGGRRHEADQSLRVVRQGDLHAGPEAGRHARRHDRHRRSHAAPGARRRLAPKSPVVRRITSAR